MAVAPSEFPPPVDAAAEFIGPPTDPADERIEVGVAIVGGGQAGLACAVRLLQLLEDDPELTESLGEVPVAVIEKGRVAGAHQLSGGVMNPGPIRQLLPDDQDWPHYGAVDKETVYWMLNGKRSLPLKPTPPPFRNHGNYVVSVAELTRWLAEKAEEAGAYVLSETVGAKLLVEDGAVVGVRTGDKGRDKAGGEKANFEPGTDVTARATVLAEGCWGHLTGAALKGLGLAAKDPQVWALGVKEVWEVERPLDRVIHTLGWPLRYGAKYKEFGGSWMYPMNREGEPARVSLGFVVGLDYADARLSVHDVLQEFKLHPLVRGILGDGKRVAWGAKAIPEGGYWAMPRLHAPGMVICGDAGGMVNVPRLKGIHYAIRSGMLAAETHLRAAEGGLERLLRLRRGRARVRDRQGPVRVAQHEAAVRQGLLHRRRDLQRDGRRARASCRAATGRCTATPSSRWSSPTGTRATPSPTASTPSTSCRASSSRATPRATTRRATSGSRSACRASWPRRGRGCARPPSTRCRRTCPRTPRTST